MKRTVFIAILVLVAGDHLQAAEKRTPASRAGAGTVSRSESPSAPRSKSRSKSRSESPSDVKSAKQPGGDAVAVKKLEENLRKIEASIGVTRQRLNSQRETQFAPDLYFMLAELLRDKASIMANLKREKSPQVPEAELDFSQEKRLNQEAIETYKIIEDRYPQYQASDRVLFTIAQEYRALSSENEALAYFKKVVEKFPESKFAVKAQIEIGDVFFTRKDYEFALKQFEKALEKAEEPERSSASYKAGWCLIHLDRWLQSLKRFEEVYKGPAAGGDLEDHDILKDDALVASVWPLLELSANELLQIPAYRKPIEYYRDAAGDKSRFRRVLARLVQRLELKKRRQEAMEAGFELFRLADDQREKKSAFETAYTHFKALKSIDFPSWVFADLRDLLLWMKRQETDLQMKQDFVKYEAVFRDLATVHHKSALATKRPEDLGSAIQGYEDYLTVYPRTKYSAQMKLNLAEAYFHAGRYAEGGQTYFLLSQSVKKAGKRKKRELVESSLESFLKGASDEASAPLVRFQSRDGYREVGEGLAKESPRDPSVPSIRFNIAKTYYDEQKFDQASTGLLKFINTYPKHKDVKTAALLYLDCFYLRDQMKEMVAAGKKILGIQGLTADVRDTVRKAASQAQMKAVRSVAGDFGSQDYATKFREFAKKNKNSALGEQALYEAFTSLRAQSQPQAFDVGEEFIASYGKTSRAKEVLLSLSQLSLTLVDYSRAASYMGVYAQRFPQDAASRSLALQAGQIYENLGELKEAVSAYQMAGDSVAALKALFKYRSWSELSKASSRVPGMVGQYYQGIALLRLGDKANALSLLKRVAEGSASSSDEKEMIAHAAVAAAEVELGAFQANGQGKSFSAALLQSKASQYQAISNLLQLAVNSGGGRWVIAALYNLGKLNSSFSDFLKKATPPAGMSAAQLRNLVQAQIDGYDKSAAENFATCLKTAEENELPANYVRGCRSRTTVAEASEFPPWASASRGPASVPGALADKLKKDPRSAHLLRLLAEAEIRGGRPAKALLVLSRAMEIAPGDGANDSLLGVAYLHMKQYAYAQAAFAQALTKDPNDPLANRGLAGLAREFGFRNKERSYRAKQGSASAPGVGLHPWLK